MDDNTWRVSYASFLFQGLGKEIPSSSERLRSKIVLDGETEEKDMTQIKKDIGVMGNDCKD